MSDLISRQDVFNAIQKLNIPEDMCVFEIISHIEVAIATLPSVENKCFDGMTNGEVIQALFPYVKIEDTSFRTVIGTNLDKGVVPLNKDWWNTPYQRGGKA